LEVKRLNKKRKCDKKMVEIKLRKEEETPNNKPL